MVLGEKHGTNYLPYTLHKNSGTLIFLPICLFADQYFIWLKKRRADFILNCLIDIIKSVHFAIVD